MTRVRCFQCTELLLASVISWLIFNVTSFAQQRPSLVVKPRTGMAITGPVGGPFSPSTFEYHVSASEGEVGYSIRSPAWLVASPSSGTAGTAGVTVRLTVSPTASQLGPGGYGPAVAFTNATNGLGSTTRAATLRVRTPGLPPQMRAPPVQVREPPAKPPSLDEKPNHLLDKSGGRLLDDRGGRLLAR